MKINETRRGELHSPDDASDDVKRGVNGGVFNSPQPPTQTIGAVIRGYKSSVSKQLRLVGFDEVLWQSNYYEHIIRDDAAYEMIANYIMNNPAKWDEDRLYQPR